MMPNTSVNPAAIRNSITPNWSPLRHCSTTSSQLTEGSGLPLHRAVLVVRVLVVLELLLEVGHVLLAGLDLEVGAPVARLEVAEGGVADGRQRGLVHRVDREERDLVAEAGLGVLLEELDAHVARVEHEHRLGSGGAQ